MSICKSAKTTCLEFIATHGNYSRGYITNFLNNDPAVLDFIDELMNTNYLNQEDLNDYYTDPYVRAIFNKVKEWGNLRRISKAKCRGRKAGTKNTTAKTISKSDIVANMNNFNNILTEIKTEINSKFEEYSNFSDSFKKLNERLDLIENLLLDALA